MKNQSLFIVSLVFSVAVVNPSFAQTIEKTDTPPIPSRVRCGPPLPPNMDQLSTEVQPRTEERVCATFFEEQTRLTFGGKDFLRSALDGEQSTFPDPAKVSNFTSDLIRSPDQVISGQIEITGINDGFAQGNFTGSRNLSFTDVQPGSNPSIGTLTVTDVDTQQSFRGNYNAGFSRKGDISSGVLLITDTNNPSQSLLINIPVTGNSVDRDRIGPTPASLTIGIPTDR